MVALICFTSSTYPKMTCEMTIHRENNIIVTTLIWFLPLCPQILSKIIIQWKCYCKTLFSYDFFLVCILKWLLESLLSKRCLQMLWKITALKKSLVTLTTLIWIISSVCPLMANDITIQSESFVTITALIWFLPGVSSDGL